MKEAHTRMGSIMTCIIPDLGVDTPWHRGKHVRRVGHGPESLRAVVIVPGRAATEMRTIWWRMALIRP